jgi:hypothetical protein
MTDRERREFAPIVLTLAAAGGTLIAVDSLRRLLAQAAQSPSARPIVATLASALVVFAVLILIARAVFIRRGLRSRSRLVVLPASSFDPNDEAVIRFASSLSRTRRSLRTLLEGPACGVRVRLAGDRKGRLLYELEVPTSALATVKAAAAAYGGVDVREIPAAGGAEDEVNSRDDSREVARAELVLGRGNSEPLRHVALDPDPLGAFAQVFAGLVPGEGDLAEVCVDLLPVAPFRRRRVQRRLLRLARGQRPAGRPPVEPLGGLLLDGSDRPAAPPAELVGRRAGQRALMTKLGSPEPLFRVQVLARVTSPIPGRAKGRLQALLAAFDAFAGDNHWRVVGLRIAGATFVGSDFAGRRKRFDQRLATGHFSPARRGIVTAGEIAGFLKPPTAKCSSSNVAHSAGAIPPPPPGLPTFAGQPGLIPLGEVETDSGRRSVGVTLDDTFFSYMAGRSRWGKTETGIGQFIHLARSGHGCLFLDPHEDGIEKIKGYLAGDDVRDRVIEINLGHAGDRQLGWNLFAVRGLSAREAQGRVDAVVDAIASTMRWDEHNTRALNLTTQAAQGLVDLGRRLPAELAPTIFQIPTLLGNADWREAVLPLLSPATRQFFAERFPLLSDEAITPVTNLIDRLRAAPNVAAMFGNPISGYEIRKVMDSGGVVLACPGEGSTRDRLVANFIVYNLLHAAKSRVEIRDPRQRRLFFAFLDEVQTYDGATSGNLAALLEQAAKFGLRGFFFNQNPERLTSPTWSAISTNRSHLATTALGAKAAKLIAGEFASSIEPEVITGLPRYTSVASITLEGEISAPFLIHGLPVEDLHGQRADDREIAALEAAQNRGVGMKPVSQILAGLDGHDARIAEFVSGLSDKRRRSEPTGSLDLGAAP